MSEVGVDAEQVLIDYGVFEQHSTKRQALIGCMACGLTCPDRVSNPYFVRQDLQRCHSRTSGSFEFTLNTMIEAGVIEAIKFHKPGQRGMHRLIFVPVESEVSRAFTVALVPPEQCQIGLI